MQWLQWPPEMQAISNQTYDVRRRVWNCHEITMNMIPVAPASRLALLASRQPCEANWKQSSSYSTHVAFTWTHREHNSMKSSCTCRYSIVISVPPCHSWHGPIWYMPSQRCRCHSQLLPASSAPAVVALPLQEHPRHRPEQEQLP